jgi:hypothetical protein
LNVTASSERSTSSAIVFERVFKNGWIADPKGKAKSVVFTEQGSRLAEEFLTKHFGR